MVLQPWSPVIWISAQKNLPKLVTLSTIKVMSNNLKIISLNFIKIHIWRIDNSNDMEFAD